MMNIFGKGRFVAFIPTNEAIQTALSEGKIPGATNASFDEDGKLTGEFDTATLKDYLNSYFITGAKHHRGLSLSRFQFQKRNIQD